MRSTRKIAGRLDEDVAFRALAAANRPDFRTISDFRKIHLGALEGLFEQVLRLALKLRQVALDGTKLKANASKHKAMSWPASAGFAGIGKLIPGRSRRLWPGALPARWTRSFPSLD